MFAVWACKQVMDCAPTNYNQSKYKAGHDKKCPSCGKVDETCAHVLTCEEVGRVDALKASIARLGEWLEEHDTDPVIASLILEYARRRGGMSMIDLIRSPDGRLARAASSQDIIGWRRFMEGMISKEWVKVQRQHYVIRGGRLRPHVWAQQLAVKLMEITHGQWLYRNVQVHDSATGILATQRKEELQQLIEDQIEVGGEGLDDDDKFLLEINLDDLETTSGETQGYWLLAIQAAREARLLRQQEQTASNENTA